MKLQPIVDNLIFWCDSQKVPHEIVRYVKSVPSKAQIKGLASLHHALPGLYEDTNGVFVSWSDAGHQEKFGMLQIPDAEECLEAAATETQSTVEWTDKEILSHGHDADWWRPRIPLFRSLVKFYDEGNGDYMALSRLDDAVYFVFHDWMDWVATEPPIIRIADDLEALIHSWSLIQFARPKNLYWMSAIASGKFTGFNSEGFSVLTSGPSVAPEA